MAIQPMGKWLLRWGLLALAVAPTLMVLMMFLRAYVTGQDIAMDRPIWTVVALQLGAIATFCWHALGNKRLEDDGPAGWILRFVVLTPFGTLEYWWKYLRPGIG